MLELVAIIVGIILLLWYLSTLDFELGTGFSEMKRKAREGKYEVVSKKDPDTQAIEGAEAAVHDTDYEDEGATDTSQSNDASNLEAADIKGNEKS